MRYWTYLLLPLLLFFGVVPAQAAPAQQRIPSIFASGTPSLDGAGWAVCSTPITWSVDDARLRPRQRAREERRLQRSLNAWGQATGLQFAFIGRTTLRYDVASTQLNDPNRIDALRRHIDIAFLPQEAVPALTGNGLGFGGPSSVDPRSLEILGGKVVLRVDHVRRNSRSAPRELKSLYLHELGHVFGLTHALAASDLMAPIVTTNTTISTLDHTSVAALAKPCTL